MHISEFLRHLKGVKKISAVQCMALCPAHDDHNPSLSVSLGQDGRILIHCFAGCRPEDVVAALGLKMSDLFPEPLRRPKGDQRYFRRTGG